MAKDTKKEETARIVEKVGVEALMVYDRFGSPARPRPYSAEVDGRDFVEKAEGYAKKIGGTVGKVR